MAERARLEAPPSRPRLSTSKAKPSKSRRASPVEEQSEPRALRRAQPEGKEPAACAWLPGRKRRKEPRSERAFQSAPGQLGRVFFCDQRADPRLVAVRLFRISPPAFFGLWCVERLRGKKKKSPAAGTFSRESAGGWESQGSVADRGGFFPPVNSLGGPERGLTQVALGCEAPASPGWLGSIRRARRVCALLPTLKTVSPDAFHLLRGGVLFCSVVL